MDSQTERMEQAKAHALAAASPEALAKADLGTMLSPAEIEAMEKGKRAPPKDPACDAWINSIDEVTAKIQGLVDGSVTPEEVDKWDHTRNVIQEIRTREQQEKIDKILKYGRSGKGTGDEKSYKWWCKGCHTEFCVDLPENKCSRCHTDLTSQADRRAYLMEKLDDAKKDKVARQLRRDKWTRWKKSQRLLGRSKFIDNKKWEYWEPESDEEEAEPIVPKDDPQFKAMEMDMQERKVRCEAKAMTAERCKERGNACLKGADYVGAIGHYAEGLEYKKDNKAIYTNKALAEIKIGRFADAAESCGRVIEYAEIFENGFERSRDMCFKAFLRRATAYRGLHRWDDAIPDLEECAKLYPDDKDAKLLLAKTKEAAAVAKQAAELTAAAEAAQKPKAPKEPKEEFAPPARPGETVRVPIEEDSEDDEELPPAAVLHLKLPQSLESYNELCEADFLAAATAVESSSDARSVFCQRRQVHRRGVKVQESFLDVALKDLELTVVLDRKAARAGTRGKDGGTVGNIVPLEPAEAARAERYRTVVGPRALRLLLACAETSDLACDLCTSGARDVLRLFAFIPKLRPLVAGLLDELCLRSISRRGVAEALGKEEGALDALVEVAREEDSELAEIRRAEKKAEQSGLGNAKEVRALFAHVREEMRKGGLGGSPLHELALSVLGNLCLDPTGKQLVQQSKVLAAVQYRLRHGTPVESVANLLVNIVSTDAKGAAVSEEAAKVALVPLFSALEEELASAKSAQKLDSERAAKAVGALHNLGATSAVVRGMIVGRDKVPVVRQLIEAPGTTGVRACGLLVKLLHEAPSCVPRHHMTPLLVEVSRQLTQAKHDPALPEVDGLVRLLGVLFAKTSAVSALLDEEAEGCAELCIGHLVAQLLQVALRAQPAAYSSAKPGALSALRGNLALVVAELAAQQLPADAPLPVKELDLGPFVEPMIVMLRKEVGGAQHNCGVAVTKLATVERYKPLVRALNGFDSLHQISMRAHQKTNQALSAAFRQ